MRPLATAYMLDEGSDWQGIYAGHARPSTVHAIRFSDGSEWDTINGWRKDTIPQKEDPTVWDKYGVKRTLSYERLRREFSSMNEREWALQLSKMTLSFDETRPGSTPPTSAPSHRLFESDMPTAGGLFEDAAAKLLEALDQMSKSFSSSGLSLTMDLGRLNCTYEAKPPTAVTDSPIGSDQWWDESILGPRPKR